MRRGPNKDFKKLLDECNNLTTQMQRAQIISDSDPHGSSGKVKDKREGATNQFRMYGLHYNEFSTMLKGQTTGGYSTNIDQLHAQLLKERQNRVQQEEVAPTRQA